MLPSTEVLLDPFVLFCGSCFVLPVAWEWQTLAVADIFNFFFHPGMLFCGALCALTVYFTKKGDSCVELTAGERMRARWYLLNGIVIHILMDGMVGAHKLNDLFYRNYIRLDRRYGEPIGSFDGALIHIVSGVELYVKGPVCLLLYFAYWRGSTNRDALEFFTCITQVYGTIVYLGQEWLSGAPHLDVDYKLTFSLHYLLYFWFAVVIGCVLYMMVPTYLGWRAYCRLVQSSAAAAPEDHEAPRGRATKRTGSTPRKGRSASTKKRR